ncbi:MAG: hypothetical protein OHK0039_45070 [Bacteroidia bacterium]
MQQLLSERERFCIERHYFEGFSYEDIAAQRGWTFKQVCGFMYRGMAKLRQQLSGEFRFAMTRQEYACGC